MEQHAVGAALQPHLHASRRRRPAGGRGHPHRTPSSPRRSVTCSCRSGHHSGHLASSPITAATVGSGAATQVSSIIRMPGIGSALQEVLQPPGGDIPRPGLFRPSTAAAAQPIPFRCVCQHADDARSHGGRVASVDHIPGLALPNGFRRPTRFARRSPVGRPRSFEIDDAKPFDIQAEPAGTTRHGEKIARSVVLEAAGRRERRRRRSRDRRRLRGPQAVGATTGTGPDWVARREATQYPEPAAESSAAPG